MLYVESHTENKNEFEVILPLGSAFSEIIETVVNGEPVIEMTTCDVMMIVDQNCSGRIENLLSKVHVDMESARIRGVVQKRRREWMNKRYGEANTNAHYEKDEMQKNVRT